VDTLNRAGKTPLPNPLRKMHFTGHEMHRQRPEQQMPHRRRIFETEEFSRLSVLTQTRLGFSTTMLRFREQIPPDLAPLRSVCDEKTDQLRLPGRY
jgi:hypothetical protein